MKSTLAQGTTKSVKSLARAVAKQIAQEPAEILKTAGQQAFGEETSGQQPRPERGEQNVIGGADLEEQRKVNDKLRDTRQMEALNRELTDIRRQDLIKDIQRRISEGEEVPLEDYPDLSPEQKQVLKAQMEAYAAQKLNLGAQDNDVPEPAAKKSRKLFNFGKKTAVKREQTHVEKPVPPSG